MALHIQPSSLSVKKYIKVGTTIPTQVKNFSIGSTDSLETQQARAQVLEKSPFWEWKQSRAMLTLTTLAPSNLS